MIPDDRRIDALVIDIRSLDTSSFCWGMLQDMYSIVFSEQYQEDESILVWRQDTGENRTVSYAGRESLKGELILKTAAELLNVNPGRICVVSGDMQVLTGLLSYPCATIGCGKPLSFSAAHQAPDYYLEDEQILINTLYAKKYYYPGEAAARKKKGAAIPASSVFKSYGFRFPLY